MEENETPRIVFGSSYEGFTLPAEAMPVHSLPDASAGNVALEAPFQVFILQHVVENMWRHVRQHAPLECAGGLFGQPFIQPAELSPQGAPITFVVVAAAIPYTLAENSRAHVRITSEALMQAAAEAAADHAGLVPVGWYHSHPGFGIFLSGYDSVITGSIFNSPWHLAIVLDPISNVAPGIFRGPEQERLSGYRVLREVPNELELARSYNRAINLIEARGWQEARKELSELNSFFHRCHEQLRYWCDKPAYRDVVDRLADVEAALGLTEPPRSEIPQGPSPLPDQRRKQYQARARSAAVHPRPRPILIRLFERAGEALENAYRSVWGPSRRQ